MAMRVAVIGCGPAGLSALKHLTSKPALFKAVGFEQKSNSGGTWAYTDMVGADQYGLPVQSSMYKNLRTNLPKEVMAFPGYSFPSNLPSFVRHEDVLQYLENYCDHFDLRRHINFKTLVHSVEPMTNASSSRDSKFKVSYGPMDNLSHTENQTFDAVMVCNGHNSVPQMPKLKGLEDFKGHVIHSHDYRLPAPFKGQTVVSLGAGASGQDISLDIASVAKKVLIAHNKPRLETKLPRNVYQFPGVDYLTGNTVVFKDGQRQRADTILLCTGYKYNFQFLKGQCAVHIEDGRVTPLYKHIVHTKFPMLSIIGLCKLLLPFPQFDNQVQFVLSYLEGTQKLPTISDMEEDIEKDFNQRLGEGLPKRHAHLMGPRQWEYSDELARLGLYEPIPLSVRTLFDVIHETRVKDLQNYKKIQYRIVDKYNYEIVETEDAGKKMSVRAKS